MFHCLPADDNGPTGFNIPTKSRQPFHTAAIHSENVVNFDCIKFHRKKFNFFSKEIVSRDRCARNKTPSVSSLSSEKKKRNFVGYQQTGEWSTYRPVEQTSQSFSWRPSHPPRQYFNAIQSTGSQCPVTSSKSPTGGT